MSATLIARPSPQSARIEIVYKRQRTKRGAVGLITITALSTIFQLCWFWRNCIHQIDYDGIDYLGIASKLRYGLFWSSINGFRSPLISWAIAIIPLDVFRAGKLLNISSYVVSIGLLFLLTKRLWGCPIVAGTATLLFTLARGVAFDAVFFVTPDLLLTVVVLVYFLILLECIKKDRHWQFLGVVHGAAFLTKAFALPWLGSRRP